MQSAELKIIITGGGTGGHLFPALAVAEEFMRRCSDGTVLFIGAGRDIDARALDGRGYARKTIRCGGLKGGNFFSRISTLLNLPFGFLQSVAIIRKFKPDLVFGVGGYVTGPVLLAAKMLAVPTCIHEQNSVPGMANRKIGQFVDQIFTSIPGSERYFPPGKCYLSGNPVRQDFLVKRAVPSEDHKQAPTSKIFTAMVIGGSQGAHALNCLVPEAILLLKERLPRGLKVIHQTGRKDEKMVAAMYDKMGVSHTVCAFFDNMAECMSLADLVICRAGATTLSELTVLGKPSILVPYPYAADDHQAKNAEFLVQGGAAKMFREDLLSKELLADEMMMIQENSAKMLKMSEYAMKLARPEAAQCIVDKCLKMITEGKR